MEAAHCGLMSHGMNGTNYYICFTLTQQVMEMYGELHL